MWDIGDKIVKLVSHFNLRTKFKSIIYSKPRGVVGWERRSHICFKCGNAFPHLFALITLLEDMGSKRLH